MQTNSLFPLNTSPYDMQEINKFDLIAFSEMKKKKRWESMAHGAVFRQNHKFIYLHDHYQRLSNVDSADLGTLIFNFYSFKL